MTQQTGDMSDGVQIGTIESGEISLQTARLIQNSDKSEKLVDVRVGTKTGRNLVDNRTKVMDYALADGRYLHVYDDAQYSEFRIMESQTPVNNIIDRLENEIVHSLEVHNNPLVDVVVNKAGLDIETAVSGFEA